MDKIKLTFDEETFDYIVDKSIEFKLGARGLRSIVEVIMIDAMYEMPSGTQNNLHVTLQYAKSNFENADINRLQIA